MAAARGVPTVGGVPIRSLRDAWSPFPWRDTAHVLTGAVLMSVVLAATLLWLIVWGAAAWSLVEGPTGAPHLAVVYAVITAVGLVPLRWWPRALTAVQLARFRFVLGVDVPRTRRPVWRQLRYLVPGLIAQPVMGAAVGACWLGLVLTPLAATSAGFATSVVFALGLLTVAPWLARVAARADLAVFRDVLGPDRADELTLQVEELARSRADVVEATDAERRRIERDLHDGAQQRLLSLAMNLGLTRETMPPETPPGIRRAIESAHDEAIAAMTELRQFVRGLHPAVLDHRGLDAALSGIVARTPLTVRLRVTVGGRCAPSVESVAYFTVSEALANVVKHADATRADVVVERIGDRLHVTVTDDGRGGAVLDRSGFGGGSGLRGLAHRAAAVDGTLRVDSPAGGPTTVSVELPCGSPVPAAGSGEPPRGP